jgi:arabinogalactan endo-1,4-beta-galactosidase
MRLFYFIIFYSFFYSSQAQDFYLGADLSYVNEMEDCGVVYKVENNEKDPFEIFKSNGSNIVRLRKWHSPAWYDNLNNGKRYSDFEDVAKSIRRAKSNSLNVLLDFHLSDNWADPSKQLVPEAWLPIVDELEVLKDSLYKYIYKTLSDLDDMDLLPELVQIGNETNKGILLSPADNSTWTLDWPRNASLFNYAIKAVRDIEVERSKEIKILIHVADPSMAIWMTSQFVENGVSDFDAIGLSYYWQWHQPITIDQTGEVIGQLKSTYPNKEVILVEVGAPWTIDSQDYANNILNEVPPAYNPASPNNQKQWLIDLTNAVIENNGKGVIYWEPTWQSNTCNTQWASGSHYENATFFDFDNNLITNGGIAWLNHDYGISTSNVNLNDIDIEITPMSKSKSIQLHLNNQSLSSLHYIIYDLKGRIIKQHAVFENSQLIVLPNLPNGIYFIGLYQKDKMMKVQKFLIMG